MLTFVTFYNIIILTDALARVRSAAAHILRREKVHTRLGLAKINAPKGARAVAMPTPEKA